MDYVIFSSGAGVMQLKGKNIIRSFSFTEHEVQHICSKLIELSCDFMVFKPIPLNHYFYYYRSGILNPDFETRLTVYPDCHEPLPERVAFNAAQFLCIEPSDASWHENLKERSLISML